MAAARWLIGDVFERLADIPDGSVDLLLTSPPFLALRSYLPSDHPDKGKEIGSEPTSTAFIDTLLHLSAEWRRVLAPHGSLCVELGDTYSGSGGAGGDYADGGIRDGQPKFRQGNGYHEGSDGRAHRERTVSGNRGGRDWPLAKSLCMVPELYRIGLVYGIHPLTGEPSAAGQWRARNVVRWCRPNPPVGALGDKVRPATSDMVVACVSGTRWFDLDAVRTPSAYDRPNLRGVGARAGGDVPGQRPNASDHTTNPGGAPPLDHWWFDEFPQNAWDIPTAPYSGAHYATWPPALCERAIQAMCPRRVCTVCGEPSRRITKVEYVEIPARPLRSAPMKLGRTGRSTASATTITGRRRTRPQAGPTVVVTPPWYNI